MQHQPAATAYTESSSLQSSARLHGRWLVMGRICWVALTLLILTLNFLAIPQADALLQAACHPDVHCLSGQLTQADLRQIQQFGLTPGFLAAYQVAWKVGTTLLDAALAALIFWRRPSDRMALYCAYMLVFLGGATYTSLLDLGLRTVAPLWYWLVGGVELLAQVSNPVFTFLFPSGRFVPRWTRWIILVIVPYLVWYLFFTPEYLGQQDTLSSLAYAVLPLNSVVIQVYRYRRVSTLRERQQTKWVVFGIAGAASGFALFYIIADLFLPPELLNSPVAAALVPTTVTNSLLLLIPISIAIAMLRSRLWDIDLVINRTLVYGALTLSVIGLYMLVVVGLGSLIQLSGNLLLSLLTTGLIAVLFQPLRARLQQGVNHVLYGERDEPARVLARLGHRLEATLTPETVLPAIVETVAQALKLPAAAITWTTAEGGAEPHTGAISGELHAQTAQTAVPLVYQQERVGDLVLALRTPGEALTPADQRFLRHLAPQIGVAVHAVRLTADLKHLTADLQRSRTELVTAREEERRRLSRDLHDGLGSVLASLNWRAGALRPLLHRDPVAAEALLVEQQRTIQAAIADIRRLVYDLRPPALDELGLIGALRELATKRSVTGAQDHFQGLQVELSAPETLPALPAAVEVAAYRIVQEALTNSAKHAQAHHGTLCLSCTEDYLEVIVADDGTGLPAEHQVGVGLLSMRERAEELGGSCEVKRLPTGGTRVHAVLPLPRDEDPR